MGIELNAYCRELLCNELSRLKKYSDAEFIKWSPSNRKIRQMFEHYYCKEICEFFYDSEPEIDSKIYHMYLDYKHPEPNFKYCIDKHSEEEMRLSFEYVTNAYKEYESIRLKINNWIEPYYEGNWDMSQHTVDQIAKVFLKSTKWERPGYRNRLFISDNGDSIVMYYFGRDVRKVDYIWTFMKRDTNKT